MPRLSNLKMLAIAAILLGARLVSPSLVSPSLAESLPESGDIAPETTGRAIQDDAGDASQSFARRPATLLERGPSGLAPQSDGNSCAPLDEPGTQNIEPRRASGPLGPHLLMDVE